MHGEHERLAEPSTAAMMQIAASSSANPEIVEIIQFRLVPDGVCG